MSRLHGVVGTLRGRLVLLVCFATLPALLFTFYAASGERTAVLLRTEKDAKLLGEVASREHTNLLEGTKDLLTRLADTLAQTPGDACPVWLPNLLAGYPTFSTIGVVAPDGALSCSARPAAGAVNMRDNAAFVRALASRESEVGDYTIGPVIGRPVLHVARAIHAPDGAIRGVVFAGIDLRWLTQLAEQAGLPPEYALLIADQAGHVLAHSGAVRAPGEDAGVVIPGLAEVATTHGKAVLDVAGVGRRFFVATPLPGIRTVTVVVGLPYDRIYGEANRAFYRTAIGLGLLTLLTIAGALLAAETSVLRVLRSLTRTARRFGAGDLGARADVPAAHGELTELTGAFNAMAEALASRQREAGETQRRLRALSHGLVVAREAEAGRIARELHDELGQVLTSVKIELAGLCRKCEVAGGSDAGGAQAGAGELSRRLDDAVDFVRRVSSELRPPVLDRLGLAAALEWQVRELEARTGLAVVLEITGVDEPIDDMASITLFRIAQEALTNVARHADATEIWVELRATDGELALVVRDDGKGIEPRTAEDAGSLGVLGMKERALLANGRLEIRGEPGAGTTVVVTLPRVEPKESSRADPAR